MTKNNTEKTAQAALYILHKNGGNIEPQQIAALLYLANRQSIARYAFPITLAVREICPEWNDPHPSYEKILVQRGFDNAQEIANQIQEFDQIENLFSTMKTPTLS